MSLSQRLRSARSWLGLGLSAVGLYALSALSAVGMYGCEYEKDDVKVDYNSNGFVISKTTHDGLIKFLHEGKGDQLGLHFSPYVNLEDIDHDGSVDIIYTEELGACFTKEALKSRSCCNRKKKRICTEEELREGNRVLRKYYRKEIGYHFNEDENSERTPLLELLEDL